MDDYRIALLFSILVLVPLAGWKITSMVKKLHSMSRRGKEENDGLTPKQKEFIEFLEKASNQSKENNDAWCEIKFWFRWCRNEIQDHWNFCNFWLKRYSFYMVFLLLRSYLKRSMKEQLTSLLTGQRFLPWVRLLLLERIRSKVVSITHLPQWSSTQKEHYFKHYCVIGVNKRVINVLLT